MKMVQGEMHRALEQWSHHEGDGIAGMCKNLLELEGAAMLAAPPLRPALA